jgi:hypothetical protein
MCRWHIGIVTQGHHIPTSMKVGNVLVGGVCSFLVKYTIFHIYISEVELKSTTWFRKIPFSLAVNVK